MTGSTVLVCEYPTLNGGERSLLAVLDTLELPEIVVVAPPRGPLAHALRSRQIRHVGLELRASGTETALPLRVRQQRLLECLRGLHPRHVHANSLAMSRLVGSIASSLPCASTGHVRDIVRLSRAAVRDLNANASLVAVSHATRDFHIRQGVEARRIRVIYNGVDTGVFAPRAAESGESAVRQQLGALPEDALIVNVGQIGLRKGQDILLKAAAVLDASERLRPGRVCHYAFVGARHSDKQESRDFEADLHTRVSRGSLARRVHWLGTRDDVPQILNAADLLVHTAHQEPLGRVLLEAASSGLPIVATEVGGTAEILTSERSALLVPAADPLAVAEAMSRLLKTPELAAELAAQARRTILDHFTIDHCARQLAELWRVSSGRGI